MTLLVAFPDTPSSSATVESIGGKARSLIEMVQMGLPVPPGVVLTARFFELWFNRIKASPEWRALVEASEQDRAAACDRLRHLALSLTLDADRQHCLDTLPSRIPGEERLLAVRSSSPDEDLGTASFAGVYESRLGVRPDRLLEAIRHCFASSLDERVVTYKAAHGFDPLAPRLAVIVQHQIAADTAGVAFTLNPVTNDYDEIVIDANWGLGESVVSGRVSPDRFIVDRVSGKVLEATVGAKQRSVQLGVGGGTIEREGFRGGERTLTDAQLAELTDVLGRIGARYGVPIDVEWAYQGDRLYLLQARPITRYVPLPPELVTEPGSRRRLYMDAALSKGMTMNAPISPLGLDFMESLISAGLDPILGADLGTDERLLLAAGGRLYVNFSNLLWLGSPKKFARTNEWGDVLLAEIMSGIDADRYRSERRPRYLRLRTLRAIPRLLWKLRRFLWNSLLPFLHAEHAHRKYRRQLAAYQREITALDYELPIDEFCRRFPLAGLFDVSMPVLFAGLLSPGWFLRARTDDERAKIEQLKLGLPGDIVVDMGIALYRLAKRLTPADVEDLDRLVERVRQRELPAAFLAAWDEFLARYGCRGPMEMDPASPRYADDPRLALRQISFMVGDDVNHPEAAHHRLARERGAALGALLRRSGFLRRRVLQRVHRLIELFGGERDTPKHYMVLITFALRKRALIEGRRLATDGRLGSPDQVFDLTIAELSAAATNPTLDLQALRRDRAQFQALLKSRVREFPQVIDSRGRILRPPARQTRAGELVGTGVSRGRVRGPVKLLCNPHEKVVEKGDVLVAYTTDPGWTPLFVNAAAIVLEVGGVLQHGAVVAREYGKPCVVGIDQVMTRLHDGQIVEVDGATGVIRLL